MMSGLPTTIFSIILAGLIGIGLFFVKHEVKEQEARLSELNREIEHGQEAIHVLKAEWSYLNDPARLRALSEKYLSMKVMGPPQVASIANLPMADPANGPVYAHAEPAKKPTAIASAAPAAVAASTPAKPVAIATATPAATKATPAKPAAQQPVVTAKVAEPAAVKLAARPAAPAPANTKVAAIAPAPTPARVSDAYRPPTPPAVPPSPQATASARPVYQPYGIRTTAPGQPAAKPARPIVIQSPALASTSPLTGEVR